MVIALVAGIDIATPMPNTSLNITNNVKESVNGVNKCADIRNPAIAIAFLDPIFEINTPPGKRVTVITIIVAATSKLTELLPISYSLIITVNSGVGDIKLRPIPIWRSMSIAWIIQRCEVYCFSCIQLIDRENRVIIQVLGLCRTCQMLSFEAR
jgi:hypothetical protein